MEEVQEAYREMVNARRSLFEDLHEASSAAQSLGMTQSEVIRVLDSSGVSEEEARNVVIGRFEPPDPESRSMDIALEQAMSSAQSRERVRQVRKMFRERVRKLRDTYRETLEEQRESGTGEGRP